MPKPRIRTKQELARKVLDAAQQPKRTQEELTQQSLSAKKKER